MSEQVVQHELEQKKAAGAKRLDALKKAQGWTEDAVRTYDPRLQKVMNNVSPRSGEEPAPFNWEALTDVEKGIYTNGLASVLPQGMQPAGEWILQKLEGFNNSWVGKLLPVFDVFAEGTERSFGMMAQYKDAQDRGELPEYMAHLGKAWQASSLFYQTINMIRPTGPTEDGRYTIYHDMPGYQELYNVRKKLIEGKTIVEAEAELYDELGALRVRAVLQDAIGHIVLDPGNIIFPKVFRSIGPGAFKAKRGELLYKLGYQSEESLNDFRKVADAAYETAQAAGRGAENAGELYATAAKAIEELAEAEGKAFTPFQKFVISVTGGMPTTAESALEVIQNSPKGLQKLLPWNWFRLTRESMAAEVMQNLSIQSQNLVGRIDDPMQGIVVMRRAIASLDTPQLGHIVSTPQGRAAMSWLRGAEPLLDKLEGMIRAATESGDLPKLRAISSLVGDDIKNIVRLMQNGEEEALLAKLMNALDEVPVAGQEAAHQFLTDLRAAGVLGADDLKQLGAVLLELPFDPDTFRLHLLQGLWDHSAKLAINKFGIEAAGFWNKAANTLKAAESLIFLRWNPAYAVNNLLNNEITGVARGMFNLMSPDDIMAYWERVGVMHPALKQGIGMGGIGSGAAGVPLNADDAFSALLKAYGESVGEIHSAKKMGTGWVGELGNKIKNLNSPFDASKFAQKVERSASMRFMTQGMIEGMKHYWKPGFGYDLARDFLGKRIADEIGDEVMGNLEKFIQDNPYNFAEKVTGAALNRTTTRAVEMAVERLGIPADRIDDVFGADFTAKISDAIGDSMQTGSAQAIRESMAIVRTNVRNHIDDWFKNADPTELLMDGPNGLGRVWGEQSWHEFDMWNAHMEATDARARYIRGLEPELRGAAWERHFAEANASWGNYFDWWTKRNKNMLDAIEQRGFNVAYADGRSLRDVMEEALDARDVATRTFHANKQKILKSAAKSDEAGAWAKGQDLLDVEYQGLIKAEMDSWKVLDDALEPLVPERFREAYRFQKEQIRNARQAYMNWNKEFYRDANKLSGEARVAKFATEYNDTKKMFINSIYEEDKLFRLAMAGDETAMATINQRRGAQAAEVAQDIAKGAEAGAAAPHLESIRAATSSDDLIGSLQKAGLDIEYGDITRYDPVTKKITINRMYEGQPISPEMRSEVLAEFAHRLDDEVPGISKGIQDIIGDTKYDVDDFDGVVTEYFTRPDDFAAGRLTGSPTATEGGSYLSRHSPETQKELFRWFDDYMKKDPETAAELRAVAASEGAVIDTEEAARVLIQDVMEGESPDSFLRRPTAGELEGKGGSVTESSYKRQRYTTNRQWVLDARKKYSDDEILYVLEKIKNGEDLPPKVFSTGKGVARKVVEEGTEGATNRTTALKRLHKELLEEVETMARGGRSATGVSEEVPPLYKLAPDQQVEIPFVPEQRKIMPDQPPQGVAADVTFYGEGSTILDAVEQSALDIIKERRVTLANLSPEAEQQVLKYVDSVGEQLKGARTAAMYHAQARRDSALLNYSRRTEFDNALGAIFPYSFWATHSIYNWALYSLERPFVLANYMRTRKMFELAGGNREIPRRLRGFGQLKVKLPFWEDWMGDGVFVNPLRIGLPIETFMYPYERYVQNKQSKEAQTARILEQQMMNDQITPMEYQAALRDKSGPVWREAYDQAKKGDDTAFDFAAMLAAPHVPLMWAYRKAMHPDEPVQPGPLLPMTRNIKSITGYLGVGDGGVNIEGGVRKFLGLPEFDEYDDYRIDRMLTNMASTNEIPTSVAIRAMIDRTGPEYEEAKRRAAKEYGARGSFALLGIPLNIFPPGEEKSLELYNKFGAAVQAYKDGDIDAYAAFFDEHPEAKARLALFDGPEERATNFLKDEIWSTYNEMPTLHRSQVREALGPEFERLFLAEKNYDAIDPLVMGAWLRMMGGDPPGTMSGNALPISLAPKEDAQILQVFYDTREKRYGSELWDDLKKAFAMENWGAAMAAYPNVDSYLGYRRDFMKRNPQIAPYLEEDPDKWPTYGTKQEVEQAFAGPNFTLAEWHQVLIQKGGMSLNNLVVDELKFDQKLPDAAQEMLDELAAELGLASGGDILGRMNEYIK